jgi:hypothetical protein
MVSYSPSAHWGLSMGKHERIKDQAKPASSDEATAPTPVSGMDVTPKMALAGVDVPKVEAPIAAAKIETPKLEALTLDMPKLGAPAIEMPKIEAATLEPATIEMPKIELASIEAPRIVPEIEEIKPAAAHEAALHAVADDAAVEPPAESAGPRVNRFTMLAAALALSAALGGMVGALAATGLMRPDPAPAAVAGRTGLEEFQALKENVVQARVELAALKVSIDAGNRNANAQFTKIGERIDRVERTQAEPAAKLNKAIDTLDRLSRADAAAQSRDVTGSILPPPPPLAGVPRPGGGIDGWVVRDVRRGTALIEGRMGIIEVDQGDIVPGLGRVDAIRKQPDGRWVVVTTKGLITTAR